MHHRISRVFVFAAMLGLVLTACGGASTVAPAAQPTAVVSGGTDVTAVPADQPTVAAPIAGGTGAADLGFRPQTNGFSFPNYGKEANVTNLTPAEVRRMFGDQVCASLQGDVCTLIPPADQWMQQNNASMSGGHCEGFAALSLLLYSNKIDVNKFGASSAADLKLEGNELLQREIAYWFVTQATQPAASAIIKGTPTDIVNVLKQGYQNGAASETYAVGIYKPDRTGGHAVTAYGVANQGNGLVWILVYDNNYPKDERRIEVDTNANTWKYEAAINPSVASELYQGDASTNTLEVVPSSARLVPQTCLFCKQSASSRGGNSLAAPAQQINQVWLEGHGQLLITNAENHKLGYSGGQFYNEIPNAQYTAVKGDLTTEDVAPIYFMPVGLTFSAVIDGSTLKSDGDPTDLAMIGPGYYIGIEGILLDKGEKDYLTLSGDGQSISYKTDYAETPDIIVGIERPGADYELDLIGTKIKPGSEVKVEVDYAKGTLTFYSTSDEASTFAFKMSRLSDTDTQTYENDEVTLEPHAKITLDFGSWDANGSALNASVDSGGDGSIDNTLNLADEN